MSKTIKSGVQSLSTDWNKLILELLVVFLGVTGGFLLNNWRIQSEEIELEIQYLNGFQHEVEYNIKELQSSIDSDSVWMEKAMSFIKALQINSPISPDSAASAIALVASVSKSILQINTYNDIVNSGHMNLLREFDLKEKIVKYYSSVEGLEFIDDYVYSFYNKVVTPFIFSEFDIVKSEFVNPGVVKSVRFSNVITGYYAPVRLRNSFHSDILVQSLALKSELSRRIADY